MKSKLDFVWFGITGRYGIWKDGLWAAMKLLEEEYDVEYKEPADDIREDAIVLFWEAPCTFQHPEHSIWYNKIRNLPNKKALLFAGGPIQPQWIQGFDHVFVESKVNSDELDQLGIPHSTAFGINTDIWKPMKEKKKWLTNTVGTCASWKRQWLAGETFGKDALVVGRGQDTDPSPFERCREAGATVLDEHDPEDLVKLVNQTHVCLQLADYWGGGQRVTLESMACGLPVICMEDSTKNREYVEESGAGLVCSPDSNSIKRAYDDIIKEYNIFSQRGIEYVQSKWTHTHYAYKLNEIIKCWKN